MRYKIEQGLYVDAFHIFDSLLNGDLINTTSYFYNVTGIHNYFNYLLTNEPEDQGNYVPFITGADRRKQIHVGNISYGSESEIVESMLMNDIVSLYPSVLSSHFSLDQLDAKYGMESRSNRQCELQCYDLQWSIGCHHCCTIDHELGGTIELDWCR